MGLRSNNLVNYGGGGGNSLSSVNIPAVVIPLAGDFLVYIIVWQAGLPLGGYVPVQPVFQVFDDLGQQWENLFDLFGVGPGGAYNSQYSISVWFCPNAKGGTFNITTLSSAVPLLQDQQGHGSLQDWQLDNRNAIITASRFDNSNTATPSLPAFSVLANQLIIAAFWCPYTTPPPALVSASPGYTVMSTFGTTVDYLDEYIARPPVGGNTPSIVTAAAEPQWMMVGLQIDISQPNLQTRSIMLPNYEQMPIEE
jgi:hypothetical protein